MSEGPRVVGDRSSTVPPSAVRDLRGFAASPEYLQLSLASALALRFRSGRFYRDARPRCINLLVTYPEGCRANCAYCGLARERPGPVLEKSFIRVEWPVLPTDAVIHRIARHEEEIARVCLSMVVHPRAWADTAAVVQRLTDRAPRVPVAALVTPNGMDRERLARLRDMGVDRLGIGLDAASERVFDRRRGKMVRGGLNWGQYWRRLEEARQVFGPRRVNAHLVVGLGETDLEMIETCRRLMDRGIDPYLFSFYPEPESAMGRHSARGRSMRPSLVRWRRLQLVVHLMGREKVGLERMEFDGRGRLRRLHMPPDLMEEAVASGKAFMTHGCPGADGRLACNRPFGSYRPGEPFRDYPFSPEADDVRRIRRQLGLEELVPMSDVRCRIGGVRLRRTPAPRESSRIARPIRKSDAPRIDLELAP